jgi:ArsR family transcriptional regulator, arsenate/arsenite/antimonite-responsive transcriptional repressor
MARADPTPRYAGMLAALGAEPRLRIFRLLLAAHPHGRVVGEILDGVGMSASTLSHHLDKLRTHNLVTVERQGTFLRYRANAAAVKDLLGFFYAECCTRNSVLDARELLREGSR